MRTRSRTAVRRMVSGSVGDHGFTFVEIMIALTILLIALSGIIALVTSTTVTAAIARQKAVMVNAASSYLEKVRQSPFDNVGTPAGNPPGEFQGVTVTNAGFVMTITPTITWGRPEDTSNGDYKTVLLTVTGSMPQGGSYLYSMSSVVGKWGIGTGPASVRIISPANGTILTDTSAVAVSMSASTNSQKRDLVKVDLYDGAAAWQTLLGTNAVTGKNANTIISWSPSGEGYHGLMAQVTDSGTSSNSETRRILLDLLPPAWPSSASGISAAWPQDTVANFYWNPAVDGLLEDRNPLNPAEADHYHASLRVQPVSGNENNNANWALVTGSPMLVPSPAPIAATPLVWSGLTGFSRYSLEVQASSPDRGANPGLVSTQKPLITGITRYVSAGTWKAIGSKDSWLITLTASTPRGPTFPWTGTATTRFYKYDRNTYPGYPGTAGTLVGTLTSTYPTWNTSSITYSESCGCTDPHPLYIIAITTLTPTGTGSAGDQNVSSCVLGQPDDPASETPIDMKVVAW